MKSSSLDLLEPSKSALTVQEYSDFESLAPLRDAWNHLVRSTNLSPAEEFDWFATLWQLHHASRTLIVLVVRDESGITGIAPLVKNTERRKGKRVEILRTLGSFHALHGTPFLLGRRSRDTAEVLFSYLDKYHRSWTLLFLGFLRESEAEKIVLTELSKRGHTIRTQPAENSPYLELKGSFEEKLKSLQPRFRTTLRSRDRRLRQKGQIELRFLDAPSMWQLGLEAIREIENDSWKVAAGTAITVQQFQWDFYRAYAPKASAAGILRIPVLYVDGEPVAYDYALLDRGTYFLMKTSYKAGWRDFYPGVVLRYLLIQRLYSENARELDFLGRDEDWKLKWTETVRAHAMHTVFRRSFAGSYLLACHKAASWLREFMAALNMRAQ